MDVGDGKNWPGAEGRGDGGDGGAAADDADSD